MIGEKDTPVKHISPDGFLNKILLASFKSCSLYKTISFCENIFTTMD